MALVPDRATVCAAPLAASLLTVRVAISLVPDAALGVNRSRIVHAEPEATTAPFEHVPCRVSTKSAAFVPLIET